MARGKQTCKILKEVRRQIAEANGIEFATSECRYKGDCLGTCPKCEAEVRYLEQQLRARSLAGKAVPLAGISAASLAMLMPMTSEAHTPTERQNFMKGSIPVVTDTMTVRGVVLGGDTLPGGSISKEPVVGAIILNRRTSHATCSDLDGHFELTASPGDILEINSIGYKSQTITATEDMGNVEIALAPSFSSLMGEFVVAKTHFLDLNVVDENGKAIDRDCFDIERVWIDEDGEEDSELLSPEYLDEKHPCRINWDYDYGLQDEDGTPLKEATLRIVAEGYDSPAIIKVKYPKRNTKKTVKFKHKNK